MKQLSEKLKNGTKISVGQMDFQVLIKTYFSCFDQEPHSQATEILMLYFWDSQTICFRIQGRIQDFLKEGRLN